jgi:hypothetical protein
MRNQSLENRIASLENMVPGTEWRTMRFIAFGSERAESKEFAVIRESAIARDRAATQFTGNYVQVTGVCGQFNDKMLWGLCADCRPHGHCLHDGESGVVL